MVQTKLKNIQSFQVPTAAVYTVVGNNLVMKLNLVDLEITDFWAH